MMWEIAAEKVTAAGATLEFDREGHGASRHDGDGATRSSRSTPTASSTSTRART